MSYSMVSTPRPQAVVSGLIFGIDFDYNNGRYIMHNTGRLLAVAEDPNSFTPSLLAQVSPTMHSVVSSSKPQSYEQFCQYNPGLAFNDTRLIKHLVDSLAYRIRTLEKEVGNLNQQVLDKNKQIELLEDKHMDSSKQLKRISAILADQHNTDVITLDSNTDIITKRKARAPELVAPVAAPAQAKIRGKPSTASPLPRPHPIMRIPASAVASHHPLPSLPTPRAQTPSMELTILLPGFLFESSDIACPVAIALAAAFGNINALRNMKSHLTTAVVPVSQMLCSPLLTSRGLTMAHIAANSGQLGVLTWLEREIGSQNLFVADKRGWNVLHFAAIGGHLEALQWLILQAKTVPALNIDIMTTTSRGETIVCRSDRSSSSSRISEWRCRPVSPFSFASPRFAAWT